MALLILALLQRIFLMSSLMLLLVWLIFFMVLIKLLPILGTISGKTKDVFRSGDSSKKFKIAEGQWYRYAPSYVSPAYHLLEGFPFIQEPPSGDLQERVLIRHHDYDQCFQSVQLLQWNSQVKFNVTVYRNLPTTRDSIMTS